MPVPGLPQVSDEQLFQLVNGVLPAWALLFLAPRLGVKVSTITAALFSALYALTMVGSMAESGEESAVAQMFTFEGVAKLLSTRSVVLPAWLHYAAFDLWVGRWEVVDALERGVPRVVMVLPLALTMFFGPTGLLLYLAAIRPWFPARTASGAAASAAKQD